MHVVFDGFWLSGGPPSGSRVVLSIIESWAAQFPDDHLTVLSKSGATMSDHIRKIGSVRIERLVAPQHAVAVLYEMRWRTNGACSLITQNFTPLWPKVRQVTFVHDLINVDHPNYFSRLERLYLRSVVSGLIRADCVVTSSISESDRIRRVLGPSVPLAAFPLGVPTAFARAEQTRPSDLNMPNGRFVLAVGRLNLRKNIGRLVDAWRSSVKLRDYTLVIAGAANGKADTAIRGVQGADVALLGAVTDEELKWLYSHCELFVMPSLDEGFGIPILEARMMGKPLALSDIPPFREIAPEAAFFDPRSSASIAGTLVEILSRPRKSEPNRESAGWDELVLGLRHAAGGLL